MPSKARAELVDLKALETIEDSESAKRRDSRARQRLAAMVVEGERGGQASPKPSTQGGKAGRGEGPSSGGGGGSNKKKSAKPKKRSRQVQAPSDEVYEINKIVDARFKNGKREFLISWKGYGDADNTWEPEDSFVSNVPIQEFEDQLRESKKAKKGGMLPSEQQQNKTSKKAADSKVPETPARASNRATKELMALRKQDITDRLLRRSTLEQLLVPDDSEALRTRTEALMSKASGLFVRLKVDSNYNVAQILEVYNNQDAKYPFGSGGTGIYLLVSFDTERTMAKLSYISDGMAISEDEFNLWSSKLRSDRLITTNPAPTGARGSLAHLHALAMGQAP